MSEIFLPRFDTQLVNNQPEEVAAHMMEVLVPAYTHSIIEDTINIYVASLEGQDWGETYAKLLDDLDHEDLEGFAESHPKVVQMIEGDEIEAPLPNPNSLLMSFHQSSEKVQIALVCSLAIGLLTSRFTTSDEPREVALEVFAELETEHKMQLLALYLRSYVRQFHNGRSHLN